MNSQSVKKGARKHLVKGVFRRFFPTINEEKFSLLYSSRPNTPFTTIVGAEIIKMPFAKLNDELVDNLMPDPSFHLALHATNFEEQSLSNKSLSRFRRKCYDQVQTYWLNLYHDYVTELAKTTAKMMRINKRMLRMDSSRWKPISET